MLYFLAKILFWSHIVIITIAVFGTILAVFGRLQKNKWLERIYFIIAGGIILSFVLFRGCFLTFWEQAVLQKINPSLSYSSGFISHYLNTIGIKIPDLAVTIIFSLLFIIGFWSWRQSKTQAAAK